MTAIWTAPDQQLVAHAHLDNRIQAEGFRGESTPMANPFGFLKQVLSTALLRVECWQNQVNGISLAAIVRSGGYEAYLRLIERLDGGALEQALRRGGATIGQGCRLNRGLTLHNASNSLSNLCIGDNVHIGRQVLIDLADKVQIGSHVTISMRTTILTHTHFGDVRDADGEKLEPSYESVTIDDDVYIGAGAILLAGITLSKGCRIGAGAVVNRSVACGVTVGGIPAKQLKQNHI